MITSSAGYYYVTIISADRDLIFGEVVDGQVRLSEWGRIADFEWRRLAGRWPNVNIDEFVIMPNHIHGIIAIHSEPAGAPTAGMVVNKFKGDVTRNIRGFERGRIVWQRDYRERVVRDDKELEAFRDYIRLNPGRWSEDEEYRERRDL